MSCKTGFKPPRLPVKRRSGVEVGKWVTWGLVCGTIVVMKEDVFTFLVLLLFLLFVTLHLVRFAPDSSEFLRCMRGEVSCDFE